MQVLKRAPRKMLEYDDTEKPFTTCAICNQEKVASSWRTVCAACYMNHILSEREKINLAEKDKKGKDKPKITVKKEDNTSN